MNLADLTATLALMPPDAPVRLDSGQGVRKLGSWRGDYAKLTLFHAYPDTDPVTAGELHQLAKDADGGTFEGYKGGEFTMHAHTPIWADDWGDYASRGISGVVLKDGAVVIATADLSDYSW